MSLFPTCPSSHRLKCLLQRRAPSQSYKIRLIATLLDIYPLRARHHPCLVFQHCTRHPKHHTLQHLALHHPIATHSPSPLRSMANSNNPKALSTKAHNGSSKCGHQSSHKHIHSSHSHSHSSRSDKSAIVERFIHDERDHRSLAVKEYDAHQGAARRRHEEELRGVVGMQYD